VLRSIQAAVRLSQARFASAAPSSAMNPSRPSQQPSGTPSRRSLPAISVALRVQPLRRAPGRTVVGDRRGVRQRLRHEAGRLARQASTPPCAELRHPGPLRPGYRAQKVAACSLPDSRVLGGDMDAVLVLYERLVMAFHALTMGRPSGSTRDLPVVAGRDGPHATGDGATCRARPPRCSDHERC
jgi:hypothetical protein